MSGNDDGIDLNACYRGLFGLLVFLITRCWKPLLVLAMIGGPLSVVAQGQWAKGGTSLLVNGAILYAVWHFFWRRRHTPLKSRGTAHFATHAELTAAGLLADEGLVLGREDSKAAPLLRYEGPGHLLTVAPTRAGKGIGAIIPNLLTTPKSVVCIDPKGENAQVTVQARRAAGQTVFVLDPWAIVGDAPASFNPLSWLDPASEDVAEDVALLADALVYDPPGTSGDVHWNEEAKALIGGLLLHIATLPPGKRTMGTLRDFLTLPADRFAKLLAEMQASTAAFGLVARAANRMLSKSDREAAGVLSSAQRHTHFLDSPKMQRVLQTGELRLEHLKQWPTSVYLVLPPDRLGAYGRWLRLMVSLIITAMARAPGDRKVLFLLDEFAALGALPAVETAMGLMAGYGIQLWPILQDLNQLRGLYGVKAGTFLSNAAVLQAFGTADHETAKHLSDLLGQSTITVASYGAGTSSRDGDFLHDSHSNNQNVSETGRALLMPDEIRRMPGHQQLLFVQGQPPIRARKVRYFEDPAFAPLAHPLPGKNQEGPDSSAKEALEAV